jgi:hypothetical protein
MSSLAPVPSSDAADPRPTDVLVAKFLSSTMSVPAAPALQTATPKSKSKSKLAWYVKTTKYELDEAEGELACIHAYFWVVRDRNVYEYDYKAKKAGRYAGRLRADGASILQGAPEEVAATPKEKAE